jgi:hypothetical protein
VGVICHMPYATPEGGPLVPLPPLSGPLGSPHLALYLHRDIPVHCTLAGESVVLRVLLQHPLLVDRAPGAVLQTLLYLYDARAAALVAVAVGPAGERAVDVDAVAHQQRANVCAA